MVSIYIHYAFTNVKEEQVRSCLGNLLTDCDLGKVTMIPRRNPTGRNYQSIRVEMPRWSEDSESHPESVQIKTALESGNQVRVDYAKNRYWIMVQNKEIAVPKPTYTVEDVADMEDERVEIESDKTSLYLPYVFNNVRESLIRARMGDLLEGCQLEKITMMPRTNKDGKEYQAVRIEVSWPEEVDGDSDTYTIRQALEANKRLKVIYDTRTETPLYWSVIRHRTFEPTKPGFQIVEQEEEQEGESKE